MSNNYDEVERVRVCPDFGGCNLILALSTVRDGGFLVRRSVSEVIYLLSNPVLSKAKATRLVLLFVYLDFAYSSITREAAELAQQSQ